MSSKQSNILEMLKTNLGALTSIKKSGNFPKDVKLIGQNFPSIMVEEKDEDNALGSGKRVNIDFSVDVWIYTTDQQDPLTIQLEVEKEIYKDLTMNGNCINLEINHVSKGEWNSTANNFEVGKYTNRDIRKLEITFKMYCVRI